MNDTATKAESDPTAYKRDLVNQITKELFSIAEQEAQAKGVEFAHDLMMSLVATIVANCVLNSLTHLKVEPKDESDELRIATAQYAKLKAQVEEAVGNGFGSGFHHFNPEKFPDFVCQVTPIDEGALPEKAH